jgi:putative FmdB family regulatory protein
MPLYEYRCEACAEEFEVLQPIGADGSELECPECGAPRPSKLMSTFACSGDASAPAVGGGCTGFT